jgi:glycosyltransferase involved in cell wall biosynthesis
MKIVIVSCVSPPEPVVAGRVNWDIAEMLSCTENEVLLITPHSSRPLGKYELGKKSIEEIIVKKNFKHIRLNSFVYPKYNVFFRSYESWDFGLKAIKYINKHLSNVDVIYATLWPFLGQYALVRFNKNKEVPVIMNIQDLYPESLFTKIKSKFLIKLLSPLYKVDKYIANKSTHLSVVSENLKNIYLKQRGVEENKITIIENWQDESEFVKPIELKHELINKYQLQPAEDKFIFMYLGNIGPVAGLEKVIEEFSLVDSSKFALIIAGSGTAKESCIELTYKLNLTNVYYPEVLPGLKSVVELQSIADVLLLPINPSAASSSVPSKLIAYMFSSKPIITSAEAVSDTGKVILESECGWLVDDSNPWHTVLKKSSCNTSDELKSLGTNGFEYAMERFSKSVGLKKIESLIIKIKEL